MKERLGKGQKNVKVTALVISFTFGVFAQGRVAIRLGTVYNAGASIKK